MPGDETYVHLIDALGVNGPLWLLAAGLIIVVSFVAIRYMPIVRESRRGEIEIRQQSEKRLADEARMRDERERDNATNAARMIDAMNRQSESSQAMASALNAISAKLEVSQDRSSQMGAKVNENHEMLATVAQQVDDIHAATVRRIT